MIPTKNFTSVSVRIHTVSHDTELGEALRAMGHKLTDAEVLKMMKVWQFICIYLCIYLYLCAGEGGLCAVALSLSGSIVR